MDQGIIEVCVKRRNNPLIVVGRIALIVAAVLLLTMGLSLLLFSDGLILAIVFIALGVGAIVGAYFCSNNLNLEFEVALVDRELRIAKIINGEKRKKVGIYDLDKLEVMAPQGSHHLDGLINRQGLKVIDCSSQDPARKETTWRCYLEGSTCLILDINGDYGEKLIDAVRKFAPRKIYRD